MAWAVANRLNMIGPLMEQPQYNLLTREKVEKEYALLYENYGLGLTIFSPLKMGILTGKYNDGIPEDSRFGASKDKFVEMMRKRFGGDDWMKEIEQVKKLKPIADKVGCDQAALALAWVIKNPNVSSAITGASRVEQIASSMKALDVAEKLTPEIMDEIDKALGNKPTPLVRRFL
jgi:aryl-alcohol dehydrogenase-like predicted oxidoreductase